MTLVPRAGAVLLVITSACATTVEGPPAPAPRASSFDDDLPPALVAPAVPTPPPRPPPAFAEHERCGAKVFLDRATAVPFEDSVVDRLVDVTLHVEGPTGLELSLDSSSAEDGTPPWSDVSLTPHVALHMPAGPARDAPAGASGALFDLSGAALAELGNLLLLPATVPILMITGRPDVFLFDAPSFAQGMFADTVLDEAEWAREVERRAAPHAAVLAKEAERQARFQTWRANAGLEAQVRRCTVDVSGRCLLHVRWPSSTMRVTFGGLPCATPPPPPPPSTDEAVPPADDDASSPSRLAFLPSIPTAPPPLLLPVPPRAPDDVRGQGAERTREAWSETGVVSLEGGDVRARWKAAKKTPAPVEDDVALLCHVDVRGSGWDIDDSAPELRLAFGYDDDVVGESFEIGTARRADIGLHPVSLRAGERIKLSAVDVGAFVDDWMGMVLLPVDGSPLRGKTSALSVECRLSSEGAIAAR
jgi:hypothetical protein